MRIAVSFAVLLAGCASAATRVAATYEHATTCPDTALEIEPMPGLALLPSHTSLEGNWQSWAVSKEAAADRAVYAQAQAAIDEAYHGVLALQPAVTPDPATLFQVTGCGKVEIIACDASDRPGCQPIADAITANLRLGCRVDRAVQLHDGAWSCSDEPVADQPACVASCASDDVECPLMCDVAAEQQCERDGLGQLGLCTAVAAARRTAQAAVDADIQVWGSWSALAQADGCARWCRNGDDDQLCMTTCLADAVDRCEPDRDPRTCRSLALGLAYLRADVE
jgi:hypothetical protein